MWSPPDDIGVDELLHGLLEFKRQPPPRALPVEHVAGRCAMRFALERRLLPLWRGEFDDLAQHLLVP